ncbi:hypothetical protein ACERII_08255 [Evansella sp. AB-rgal1]|uniref:hypothetical protein n=1 Tax=Evansella sp. AB-rgal1 TaxID=3242696 RepID=UPI00359F11DB
MRRNIKWIISASALFLFISAYYSFSFAAEETPNSQANENEKLDFLVDKKQVNSSNDKRMEVITLSNSDNDDKALEQNKSTTDFASIFIEKEIGLGDVRKKLLDVFGEPLEEGMYEGGHFYDYGDKTYFVNPETEQINAIAVPGEKIPENVWLELEESLKDSLKLEGMNEMDGLWMEIYDWKEYDILVERIEEGSSPIYIWLLEDSLFTE